MFLAREMSEILWRSLGHFTSRHAVSEDAEARQHGGTESNGYLP